MQQYIDHTALSVKQLDNWNDFLKSVKANYLVHIAPSGNGSLSSADYKQKLFSLEHDARARFLLVSFLREQKKEDDPQR